MQPSEGGTQLDSITWLGRFLKFKRQKGQTLPLPAQRRLVEVMDEEMGRKQEMTGCAVGLLSTKIFLNGRKRLNRTIPGSIFTGVVLGGWVYCLGMEIRDPDPSKTFITQIAKGDYNFRNEDRVFCKLLIDKNALRPKQKPLSSFMRTMRVLSLDHISRSLYIYETLEKRNPSMTVNAFGIRVRSRLLLTMYSFYSPQESSHRITFPNRNVTFAHSGTIAEAQPYIGLKTYGLSYLWWKYSYLSDTKSPF